MKIHSTPKGAPAVLTAAISMLLFTPVLLVTVSCTSPSKDTTVVKPNISTFIVGGSLPIASTAPETLTITTGTSAYLAANFAQSGGTAILMPGSISMVSGVPVKLGPLTVTTPFTLTVSNSAGDLVTRSTTITVVAQPDATITGPATAITGTAGLTATVPYVPTSSYLWTITGGSITAGDKTNTVTFTAGPTGTLTLSARVTNAGGTVVNTSLPITVTARPPVGLNYPSTNNVYYKGVTIHPNVPALGVGGDPVKLWTVNPALPAGLVIDPVTGAITGAPTTITAAAPYTVSAANSGGASTQVLTLEVKNTPAVVFTANPATIAIGGTSILSWTGDASVTSVSIDQSVPGPFAVPNGTKNVNPVATTTYNLTANLTGGSSVILPALVTVQTAPLAFASLSATKTLVNFGDTSTLSWGYANNSLPSTLTLNGQDVMGLLNTTVTPVRRQTFTLAGSNAAGNDSKTVVLAAKGVDAFAGSYGGTGMRDGVGAAAQFNNPMGMTTDAAGNLYVADYANYTIRKITPGGVTTTFAGQIGVKGLTDNANPKQATLNGPRGLRLDAFGNMVVADAGAAAGGKLRLIQPSGNLITVTGADNFIKQPYDFAIDYAASSTSTIVGWTVDYTQRSVTKLSIDTTTGVATAAANMGTLGLTASPAWSTTSGLSVDDTGILYVADSGNNCVRAVKGTTVTVVAGVASTSLSGAPTVTNPALSCLSKPYGLATVTNGGVTTVYIADKGNNAIRRLKVDNTLAVPAPAAGSTLDLVAGSSTGLVLGGSDGPGATATFSGPQMLALKGGNLYVADAGNPAATGVYNNVIRVVDLSSAAFNVTTLAGSARSGAWAATDGPGATARFKLPVGVAKDSTGNLIVADSGNGAIRKITPAGVVSTLASGLVFPSYVALDGADNIFFIEKTVAPATSANLKFIKKSDGSIQTVPVSPALSLAITGLAVDAAGVNAYVGDATSIKQVAVASGAATASTFTGTTVSGLAVDASGIYFSEAGTNSLVFEGTAIPPRGSAVEAQYKEPGQ